VILNPLIKMSLDITNLLGPHGNIKKTVLGKVVLHQPQSSN